MTKYNVIVVGATGLVGSNLVKLLIKDERVDIIHLFVRNKTEFSNPRIIQHIVDFNNLENSFNKINASIIYCCIGTTIKKAGSQTNFENVDLNIPTKLAINAKKNNINTFVIISSVGANPLSANFYLRTKGKMEDVLKKSNISNTIIFRPSMLLGKRNESRLLEKVGISIFNCFAPFLIGKLSKYRPINAKTLSKAMINISFDKIIKENIIEWKEIIRIAKI